MQSFHLSNSSSSECVTDHRHRYNIISYQDAEKIIITGAFNHHFENTSATVNNSTHKSPWNLPHTSSASFTSSTCHESITANACIIYVDTCSLETEVHRCQFLSCSGTTLNGSAIYTLQANVLNLYTS